MDGVLEKFSVYDFFNVLGAGAVFLFGLQALDMVTLQSIVNYIGVAESTISIIGLLGICYLCGSVLQQIGAWVSKRKHGYVKKVTETLLCTNGNSILSNQIKVKLHRKLAFTVFKEKEIDCDEHQNCFHLSDYYFTYCTYYIQVRDKHHKAEKMRSLKGISSLLMLCFCSLAVLALLKTGILMFQNMPASVYRKYVMLGIGFIVLTVLNQCAYRRNVRYWIRMVLASYEACVDMDRQRLDKVD